MSDRKLQTKIMTFGTFDGLHEGHLNFFKQARKLAKKPFLIVSIARDKNVKKIKGKPSFLNERKRKKLIESCNIVDKVVYGGISKYVTHIIKESPEYIALGYDQIVYTKNLKKDLLESGKKVKIVRLGSYKEKIYKNHLLNVSKSQSDQKSAHHYSRKNKK